MSSVADCRVIGRWRIVGSDVWDRDYLDLVEPAFLKEAVQASPFEITHVLTDRGSCFTADGFEVLCRELKAQHRTTRPYTPKTTDVIDKCFLRRSEVSSWGARVTAWRRAGYEGRALPRSLYRRPSVAAPVRTRLGPRGFHPLTKRA